VLSKAVRDGFGPSVETRLEPLEQGGPRNPGIGAAFQGPSYVLAR
jgi:hypothetical protein